ncbi:hypothetical protein FACS189432_01580 [Bacteroidia bacterium]|nr:hypothetical protein FACS189426_01340 [Bacteroidia bacterium]GHT26683.1 hypothetical protein FACS189432_01580 [Bacteroidia bacterium]
MARPVTKTDLIIAANGQFDKLWKLIDFMTESEQTGTFGFEDRDKNLRDVLIHLYEWHQLLLNWANANRKGEQKPFLPEPYNWKTYPQMNVEFWEKHQKTSLIDSKKRLKESHSNVMNLIETFSNEELFTKKYFPWTGTTNLGSYCVSATSSHYDWAMKKIKMHIKNNKCCESDQ